MISGITPNRKTYISGEDNEFVDKIIVNVKSNLITITEDKLENILLKNIDQKSINKSWITPLSIFITTLITNLSANFIDIYGLKSAVWEAIFILVTIGTAIWLIISIIRIFMNRGKGSLPNLIARIKNAKDMADE